MASARLLLLFKVECVQGGVGGRACVRRVCLPAWPGATAACRQICVSLVGETTTQDHSGRNDVTGEVDDGTTTTGWGNFAAARSMWLLFIGWLRVLGVRAVALKKNTIGIFEIFLAFLIFFGIFEIFFGIFQIFWHFSKIFGIFQNFWH